MINLIVNEVKSFNFERDGHVYELELLLDPLREVAEFNGNSLIDEMVHRFNLRLASEKKKTLTDDEVSALKKQLKKVV